MNTHLGKRVENKLSSYRKKAYFYSSRPLKHMASHSEQIKENFQSLIQCGILKG